MRRAARLLSPDGLALAALFALVAAVFGRAVLSDEVFYRRDIHAFWYPHIERFVRSVAEGSAPLWNPYDGFGAPLLANPSLQLAYPLTWLNLLLAPATYYKLFVIGHTALGGVGFFLLSRHQGMSSRPALLGAASFCLSGPFLSAASLFHHFAGAAWMPWVLLATARLVERPGLCRGLALGAAGAGQLLAGSADVALMTAVAGLFLLYSWIRARPEPPRAGALWPPALVAAALAAGLVAVQWLPTAAILAEGWRLRLGPGTNLYWSLHPASLLDILVPGLLAHFPISDSVRAALFESREPLLESVYLGAAGAYLVLLGLLTPGRHRVASLAGLTFFTLCALGRHAFPLPFLLWLPGFGSIRYPVKYLWGASLFWALLVSGGAVVWGRAWSAAERRVGYWAGILSGVLALVAFSGTLFLKARPHALASLVDPAHDMAAALGEVGHRLSGRGAILALVAFLGIRRARRPEASPGLTAALCVLVLGDLAGAAMALNDLAPAALLKHRPPVAERIGGGSRIYVMVSTYRDLRAQMLPGPSGWRPEWTWVLGGIDLLIPPMGSRWEIRGSYDGDFTGLAARDYSDLVVLTRAAEGTVQGQTLLARAGVQYVVTLKEGDWAGLREVARAPSVFISPVRLLRVPDPFPPAYVVEGLRPASAETTLLALGDPRFDARREAIVPLGEPEVDARDGFRGEALVAERRADSLVIEAELNRPGLLVVLEAFQSGWRVEVDGARAPLLRANGLFRGVRLRAGRHRVRMIYRPSSVIVGAGISAASAVILLLLWARSRREPQPRDAS